MPVRPDRCACVSRRVAAQRPVERRAEWKVIVDGIGSDRLVSVAAHERPTGCGQTVPDFCRPCAAPEQVASDDHRIKWLVLLELAGNRIEIVLDTGARSSL